MMIHQDCRYFKGDIPCVVHKQDGSHCSDCHHFQESREKILIIKLGAIGDIIRTTPLLTKIKERYANADIFWLSRYPEVIPEIVDHILKMELPDILYISAIQFDLMINLDKDREACALASLVSAKEKKGFILKDGKCSPANENAVHKFNTGIFDDINRKNQKSYLDEIFEISGFNFKGENYILRKLNPSKKVLIKEPRPLIGLNTGCGARWETRLWPEESWSSLATQLKAEGYGVLVLGGEREHEKNMRISTSSGASYLGHLPLEEFILIIEQCDLIVTAVTMALHIAIGLKKKIILFNNVFNKAEFELYGLGTILEPNVGCKVCFKQYCEIECMNLLRPEVVMDTCLYLLEPGYPR